LRAVQASQELAHSGIGFVQHEQILASQNPVNFWQRMARNASGRSRSGNMKTIRESGEKIGFAFLAERQKRRTMLLKATWSGDHSHGYARFHFELNRA
jgi:hypothetical protein